jgi:amino acid transporter
MILLSFFYQEIGWESGTVLLIALAVALLSLVGFTIYRLRSGKEMRIQTQRGWIIFGTVVVFVILVYSIVANDWSMPSLDNLIPIVLSFIVLITGIWWGIRQTRKNP